MHTIKSFLLLLALSASQCAMARETFWQPLNHGSAPERGSGLYLPRHYQVFQAAAQLKPYLLAAATKPQMLEIPMPDGSLKLFMVSSAPVMDQALMDRYPTIRTFDAVSVDGSMMRGKLDITEKGFHAMIMDAGKMILIDPLTRVQDGQYLVYYRNDFDRPLGDRMICDIGLDMEPEAPTFLTENSLPQLRVNGNLLRNYRLALSCTNEYASAVDGPTPTKAGVLSAMVTSVNRVSGVYQTELAVTLTLIGNTDTLIFLPGDMSSPFIGSNNNGSALLGLNQTLITNRIGSANYDIGHVFSTGGGGIAGLGVVCNSTQKARGVTGLPNPVGDPFDIDYVAHEIGHQFGGAHTFNASTGSCSGNGSNQSAYEPGSGSTIMAYAGICSPQDLQPNSDPFFHARSLEQIHTYITGPNVSSCPTTTNTNNVPPVVNFFTAVFEIPSLTPFELEAPGVVDNTNDTLLYSWEQWNRGSFGSTFQNTRVSGPIFRSFSPTASSKRIFPRIDSLVKGVTSYFGEKVPDTNRSLRFKLTVRDVYNGNGSFNFPDDTIRLNVSHNGIPFAVTGPTTPVSWLGGSLQTITWQVSNTNTAPINCDSVDIYLSPDGGFTFPYYVGRTANDGSEAMTIPNIPTTSAARIKVKGANNVFFNLSPVNFTVVFATAVSSVAKAETTISVFPVPASDYLTLESKGANALQVQVMNAMGQKVWSGTVHGKITLPVKDWAKGSYYIRYTDLKRGEIGAQQVSIH